MPKHRQPDEHRRREPSLRRVRQPWHLDELETAAQTDVDIAVEGAGQPVDDEAHQGIAFGTSARESEQTRTDSGLSVDPEDLGLQFLRDATEQDNFESEFQPEAPTVPDAIPVAELLSEETLLLANQEESDDVLAAEANWRAEPFVADVDLLSNVIHEASLFDEPTEQDEMLTPRIESDELEPNPPDAEARALEQERERKVLRRLRLSRPTARGRASRR
jgi:hypothetical protein